MGAFFPDNLIKKKEEVETLKKRLSKFHSHRINKNMVSL